MARAKAKPRGANRYSPPTKSAAPNWVWLISGMAIGGFIMFLLKLEPNQDIRGGNNPATQASTQPKRTNTQSTEPKYTFSDILRGDNAPMLTEAQIRASKEEEQRKVLALEAERKRLDGERARAMLTAIPTQIPAPTPQVISVPTNSQVPVSVSAPLQPIAQQPIQQTTPVATPTPAHITPMANTRFFLQVGSYPSKNGAEGTRAKLLMLGQDARVEDTKTHNKQWFRVLVGPFKTRDEAAKAQKQLSNNGFGGTLVIPRQI